MRHDWINGLCIADAEAVTRPWPANLTVEHSALFAHERAVWLPPAHARVYRNANVWAQPMVASGGRIRYSAFAHPAQGKDGPFNWRLWLGTFRLQRSIGHSLLYFQDTYTNHSIYHWLCDSMPRALALGAVVGKDLPILLPESSAGYTAFQEQSLQWLGFSGPIIRQPYTHGLRVPQLLTCSLLAPPGHHRRSHMHALRGAIRTHFGAVNTTGHRRIHISREHAASRRTVNEAEVTKVLAQFDIETVHLERLTPEEQVRTFLDAQLIVGNHGGGLPAMIYAPETCRILEIRSRTDGRNNCYYSLACALDYQYFYHLTEPTQPERGFWSDWQVDTASLARELEKVIDGLT